MESWLDMCKIAIPLNPMPDNTCRTIKYQYFKNSMANFVLTGDRGATAVIMIEDDTDE